MDGYFDDFEPAPVGVPEDLRARTHRPLAGVERIHGPARVGAEAALAIFHPRSEARSRIREFREHSDSEPAVPGELPPTPRPEEPGTDTDDRPAVHSGPQAPE